MATGSYPFNDQLPAGRMLRRVMNAGETLLDEGVDLLAAIPQMIDGDGSSAAHFNEVTVRFGFADNTKAKAACDEFQSFMSKVTGNGSVSSVNAAFLQAFAKFR